MSQQIQNTGAGTGNLSKYVKMSLSERHHVVSLAELEPPQTILITSSVNEVNTWYSLLSLETQKPYFH